MNERYADLRASLELRLGQLDLNLCEDHHGSYGTIDVTREQVNFITAAHPEAIRSLLADYDRLRKALSDAQRSLDTIATLGGSKADFMGTMRQVREYANSRARMARCALTQEGQGVNQSLTTERDGAAKGADHIDAQRAELETLRGVLAGVPQDAIDGGWTAAGISAYAKNLEAENRVLRKALTGAQEPLCWVPEDELPKSLTSNAYDALFPYSRVDFIRQFPIYGPCAAPVAQDPDDGATEAAEIIESLITNLEKDGMYSQESTVGFLTQALYCLRPANAAPVVPVAQGLVQLAWRVVDRETRAPRTDWIDGDGGDQAAQPVFSGGLIQRAYAAPVAAQAQSTDQNREDEKEQAVIEAAMEWWTERGVRDWGDVRLAKAVVTLAGDWPGCDGCDFMCDETCTPATVAEQLDAIDHRTADLVHAGILYAYEGWAPPVDWKPDEARTRELRPKVRYLLAPQTQAARDVLAERRRQVTAEGWTREHDDEHSDGSLAAAAACYAITAGGDPRDEAPGFWPWDESWWKPGTERRNLVKAGALILAEIERIDRAAARAAKGE